MSLNTAESTLLSRLNGRAPDRGARAAGRAVRCDIVVVARHRHSIFVAQRTGRAIVFWSEFTISPTAGLVPRLLCTPASTHVVVLLNEDNTRTHQRARTRTAKGPINAR
jgi:hypothetical protein